MRQHPNQVDTPLELKSAGAGTEIFREKYANTTGSNAVALLHRQAISSGDIDYEW